MAISSGLALLLAASAALNPVAAAPSSKSTLFATEHVVERMEAGVARSHTFSYPDLWVADRS